MTTQMFEGLSRLGIMGGTFDPPHNGHFNAATAVATVKQLDRVIFIPASEPWQKTQYSAAEDRFTMTQLGTVSDTRFVASRIELDRKGPTYTVDTLETLCGLCPGAELFLILGADAASNIGTWHRVEDIARFAKLLVVTRPGSDPASLEALGTGLQMEAVEVPPVDVSSTQVREAVRNGRSIDDLVPVAVAEFIERRNLYRDRDS
jgi:nicotinate-nucleotide adenylyltransferase